MSYRVNHGDVAKSGVFGYNGAVRRIEANSGEAYCEVSELWRKLQGWPREVPSLWLQGASEDAGKTLPRVQSQSC